MSQSTTPKKLKTNLNMPSSPVFSYKKNKKRDRISEDDDEIIVKTEDDMSSPINKSSPQVCFSADSSLTDGVVPKHYILYSTLSKGTTCASHNTNSKNILAYAMNLENANITDKSTKKKKKECVSNDTQGFLSFSALTNKNSQMPIISENKNEYLYSLTDSELLSTTDILQDFATKVIDVEQWNNDTQMPKNYLKSPIDNKTDKILDNIKRRKIYEIKCIEDKIVNGLQFAEIVEFYGFEAQKYESKCRIQMCIEYKSYKNTSSSVACYNITDSETLDFKKPKLSPLPMFSTASGKKLNISKSNIRKAESFFAESGETVNNKYNWEAGASTVQPYTTANNMEISIANTHDSNTLVEKHTSTIEISNISDKSMNGFEIVQNYDPIVTNPEFEGFQTAKGKKIIVSKDVLSKYSSIFSEDNNEHTANTIHGNENISFIKNSSVCYKKNNLTDNNVSSDGIFLKNCSELGIPSLKVCKKKDMGSLLNSDLCYKDSAVTNNKKTIVSNEASLQINVSCKNQSDNNMHKKDNVLLNAKFCGFQTASGKTTKISKQALSKAYKLLQEGEHNDLQYVDINAPLVCNNVTTAGGKNPKVSQISLLRARENLQEDFVKDDNISPNFNQETKKESLKMAFNGFHTASGKMAKESKHALSKACELFKKDNHDDAIQLLDKKVTEQTIDRSISFQGFQTASGKKSNVSEKALSKARKILQDDENEKSISHSNEVNKEKPAEIADNQVSNKSVSEFLSNNNSNNQNQEHDLIPISEFENSTSNVIWQFNQNISPKVQDCIKKTKTPNKDDEVLDIKEPGSPILMKNPLLISKRRSKVRAQLELAKCDTNLVKEGVNLKITTVEEHVDNNVPKPVIFTQEIKDITNALLADEMCFEGSIITNPSLNDINDLKPVVVDTDMSVTMANNNHYHMNTNIGEKDIFTKNITCSSNNSIPQKTCDVIPKNTFKVPYKPGVKKVVDNNLKRKTSEMNLEFSTPFNKKHKQAEMIEDNVLDEDLILINDTQIISKMDERDISEEVKMMRNMEYDKQKIRLKSIKRRKIDGKPLRGSTLTNRLTSSNRISWPKYVKGLRPQENKRDVLLYKFHMKKSIIDVNIENVQDFCFSAWDYYSIGTCKTNTSGVLCGDGATLMLDDESNITLDRIITAFLTSPGIDTTIVADDWVRNHFKWIVLKLAGMERSFPMLFANRACTPNNLMLQLKYRYDREIDEVERSCLKRILQADDTAAKPMILYCCNIYAPETENTAIGSNKQTLYELELSDGWYSIRTKIDALLHKVILDDKLKIGDKLYIVGSHLLNCAQGCDPLEILPDIRLQIFSNSCTKARWYDRLGYTGVTPMFPCLGAVHHLGGLVYLTEFVIVRRYPIVYLVKHNGKTTMHSEKLETKLYEQYEKKRSEEVEKVYSQVLKTMEQENIKNKINSEEEVIEKDITKIKNAEQLFNFINKSHDPSSIQHLLTDSQKAIMSEHYTKRQSDMASEISNRVQEIMSTKSELFNRTSSQLLKIRVMPICREQKPEHNRSAIISIWRPSLSTSDILKEKNGIRANNCTAESIRNGDLQLSAGRQASFKIISSNSCISQHSYPHRIYTSISDMYRESFNPPFNEIDTVGVVIHISPWHSAHSFQTVYIADLQHHVVGVAFWGGIQHHGYDQIIQIKSVIACCNLQWRNKNGGKWIPNAYATDISTFSSNPRQDHLQHIFESFVEAIKNDINEFVNKCEENLSKSKTSMSRSRNYTPNKLESPMNISDMGNLTSPVTPIQKKISILSMIPEPPKLSPLQITTPKKILRPFKNPTKILSNIDDKIHVNSSCTAKYTDSPPLSLE